MESTELIFNPFDPDFRVRPYPTYERLRAEDPVHEGMFETWVLSRYADCEALLRDPRASSDERKSLNYEQFRAERPASMLDRLEDMRPFLFLDPPDHTRLRKLVNKAFTQRRVEALRTRVAEVVDELLDLAGSRGEMDVVADLAYPLPVKIISEMLGVPASDEEQFKAWSRVLAKSLDPMPDFDDDAMHEQGNAALAFIQYFRELIDDRRARPREDLLSALVAAEEAGDKLTAPELFTTLILLLIAGHETTVNLIGNGLLALLRDRDALVLLRDDPSIERWAVEELLRYDPPVQMTIRTLTGDYEIDGYVVKTGQQAVVLIGSANRDPARFADADRLVLGRTDNPHLAFGHGTHFCLGAPLARLEGQIALTSLIRRFEIEADTDDPPYKENIVLRGLASLPVTLRAR
jgi:hypothetical protein